MSEVILIRKKEAAIREIKGLKELNHPNIIRFINVKQTNKHLYLIMEYCEGGSLENYIEQNLPDERECLYFFSQIVSAFQYLIKQKKRKHGDIKPANILLHNRQIKLADFGFSKKFVEESDQSNSYAGSPLFTSPQILEGSPFINVPLSLDDPIFSYPTISTNRQSILDEEWDMESRCHTLLYAVLQRNEKGQVFSLVGRHWYPADAGDSFVPTSPI